MNSPRHPNPFIDRELQERPRRRHAPRRRTLVRGWLALVVLVSAIQALVWLAARPALPVAAAGSGEAALAALAPGNLLPANGRRIYPYSVVPGGVLDRDELLRAEQADRLVAAHYVGFDVPAAYPVKTTARAVYVSYRKDNRIFWTRHKVRLASGETVLSDGVHEIRTRCGNRISDAAQLPVADTDPPPDAFDTPFDSTGTQAAGIARRGLPHGELPEPQPAWLMGLGLVLLAATRRLTRR